MSKRDSRILELLTREHRIEVSTLAELLGVSSVTVRKDLDGLEARGVIQRQHGWAVLGSPDDINGRLAYHYDAKRRIAHAAAKLVKDSDTVMIESGSCCALLALELASSKHDVTIVTNSAFIAGYIRNEPGASVILLGGNYQNDSQAVVGPMVRSCVLDFNVDLLFVGADGWTERDGFSNSDRLRAEAVRDMASQAERIIVLTESEKFTHRGIVPLRLGSQVSDVITDDAIAADTKAILNAQGRTVTCVKA